MIPIFAVIVIQFQPVEGLKLDGIGLETTEIEFKSIMQTCKMRRNADQYGILTMYIYDLDEGQTKVYVDFVGGRVKSIAMKMDPEFFSAVEAKLRAKYGPPAEWGETEMFVVRKWGEALTLTKSPAELMIELRSKSVNADLQKLREKKILSRVE